MGFAFEDLSDRINKIDWIFSSLSSPSASLERITTRLPLRDPSANHQSRAGTSGQVAGRDESDEKKDLLNPVNPVGQERSLQIARLWAPLIFQRRIRAI